jgi:hypothetical protein
MMFVRNDDSLVRLVALRSHRIDARRAGEGVGATDTA